MTKDHKKYYYANVEKKRESARLRAHQPKVRSRQYQRYYGISVEEYEALISKQKGLCAVCQQPETRVLRGKTTRLCVDHDHETKEVRGLLCSNCNAGVGRFQDNPERILRAYEYLKERELKKNG